MKTIIFSLGLFLTIVGMSACQSVPESKAEQQLNQSGVTASSHKTPFHNLPQHKRSGKSKG